MSKSCTSETTLLIDAMDRDCVCSSQSDEIRYSMVSYICCYDNGAHN